MVAGYSERVEDLREVINVLKKSGEELDEEELRRKAREIVIQKGIDIATQAARNKGTCIKQMFTCTRNSLIVIFSYIGGILALCPHILQVYMYQDLSFCLPTPPPTCSY